MRICPCSLKGAVIPSLSWVCFSQQSWAEVKLCHIGQPLSLSSWKTDLGKGLRVATRDDESPWGEGTWREVLPPAASTMAHPGFLDASSEFLTHSPMQ
jgi:hypothetical protein